MAKQSPLFCPVYERDVLHSLSTFTHVLQAGRVNLVTCDRHVTLDSLPEAQEGFLEANQKCFWNPGLLEAVRVLEFQGYVAPGVLLVRANPCALEVIRAAWARNVLKAPANYTIASVAIARDNSRLIVLGLRSVREDVITMEIGNYRGSDSSHGRGFSEKVPTMARAGAELGGVVVDLGPVRKRRNVAPYVRCLFMAYGNY
ncbi:Storkhead box 1 [Homalodisca vitripennis]|nr:Storkhead box 1 [Homalodisca vitripennis]